MQIKIAVTFFLMLGMASAAISPGGIVNAASFRPQGLPNSMIAQGSIFSVFGSDLANPGEAQVSAFPLPLSLGGTSAQVTVGGTTVDCFMIFTTPGQLAILLPSAAPVGSGTLTLTVNGLQMSEPIGVVASSPGIFSQNSQGSGPASLQNFISPANTPLNQVDQAINNDEVGILWLTGVGPVSGDEASGPLPGNLSGLDVQVFVGGVLVTDILYVGRSGCCSGVDQIVFRIPLGVEGCWAAVVVVINGVPSNATSISVAPSGTVCSQPGTFSSNELSSLLNGGTISQGALLLVEIENDVPAAAMAQLIQAKLEFAQAAFARVESSAFRTSTPQQVFGASNSCITYSFKGRVFEFVEVVNRTELNAGAVSVTGPNGTQMLEQTSPGNYLIDLVPFTGGVQAPSFLTPGSYTFQGTGGPDVGPFTATRNYTDGIDWTNKNQLSTINRSQGLTVTWNGGDPSEENIWIFGSSFGGDLLSGLTGQVSGAAFFCSANAGLGSFTVGPEILSALPVSAVISAEPLGTFSTGSLQVGTFGIPRPFSAPGIDIGFFSYTNTASILTDYK